MTQVDNSLYHSLEESAEESADESRSTSNRSTLTDTDIVSHDITTQACDTHFVLSLCLGPTILKSVFSDYLLILLKNETRVENNIPWVSQPIINRAFTIPQHSISIRRSHGDSSNESRGYILPHRQLKIACNKKFPPLCHKRHAFALLHASLNPVTYISLIANIGLMGYKINMHVLLNIIPPALSSCYDTSTDFNGHYIRWTHQSIVGFKTPHSPLYLLLDVVACPVRLAVWLINAIHAPIITHQDIMLCLNNYTPPTDKYEPSLSIQRLNTLSLALHLFISMAFQALLTAGLFVTTYQPNLFHSAHLPITREQLSTINAIPRPVITVLTALQITVLFKQTAISLIYSKKPKTATNKNEHEKTTFNPSI